MNQGSLFDHPYGGLPGFVRHSETSKSAAVAIVGTVATHRAVVLSVIRQACVGFTADEVAAILGHENGYAVAPRIRELELAGKVRRTDRKRLTRRGREAFVYVYQVIL